jgi:hypothetical protein
MSGVTTGEGMRRAWDWMADNWPSVLIGAFMTSFVAVEIAKMWGWNP